MSEKSNSYSIPILALFERLTVLNGLASILDNQLDNFKSSFRRSFEKSGADPSLVFAGFALGVQDIVEPSNLRYTPYFPVGAFTRQGEEYYEAADEVIVRWNALMVAQSYEAFETYLRDQASTHYFMFPPEKPRPGLRYLPIERDELDSWKSMFRESRWDTFSILKLLRSEASQLARIESNNNLGINLEQWLSVLVTLRHGAAHSDFKVRLDQFRVPDGTVSRLLRKYFPGSWHEDVYTPSIDREHAKQAIQMLASYAHLVHKSLADTVGLQADVVRPHE